MMNRRSIAILIVLIILVVPHVLISLPGIPKSESRPLTLGALFVSVSLALCWCGLDPRSRMLGYIASYDDPKYDSARPKIVRTLRLGCIGFGVFVFSFLALPFVAVSIRIVTGQKPIEIVGVVERNSSPSYGAYFDQSVTLSSVGGQYELFYSLVPLRVGDTYELEVLTNSHLVLDFHKLS